VAEKAQLEEKKVEPNSGLGEAITYLLKYWDRFTLFLRKAGAPLDNNICERALKKSILHRKNSLFYLTENGAQVGDIFMKPDSQGRVVWRQSLRLSYRVAAARR
jgi:transposase